MSDSRHFHNWTDERIELLRKLLADDYSASQAATQLGVTRNAVIGKAARLGIALSAGVGRPKNSPKPRFIKPSRLRPLPAIPTSQAIDLPPDTVANPVTLMQLEVHHCRWPVDMPSGPMMYCGGDAMFGCPYCSFHAAIAYNRQPSQPRGERELLIRRMAKMRGGKAA